MVQHLVHGLFRVVVLGIDHARAAVAEQRRTPVALVVDFVEGHPVFDLIFVALKYHFREAHKEIDHFTVGPSAIFLNEVQRHFKVGEGDHRLDVVLQQFIEHVVVKLQPLFVWLSFVAFREDARPGDGGTETFEAHLGKQPDVFFVMAVEVDGFVVGVIFAFNHFLRDFSRNAVCAAGEHVADAWPFAAFVPAAFNLVRRYRAAP